ncbi:RNA-directed DNA polymerase (Reverse transcriptase), partial [Trifolium medium]|nr:RNA-directed DNA polymerase (Reverse transcriptase) [Trifolium medium]
MDVYDWLKVGATSSHALIFSAGVWWSWRHRNLMCLNNETWPLSRLSFNIRAMVETFRNCFYPDPNDRLVDRHIRWNNNNYSCVILNVDGSCLGSSVRSGFGGVIRNTFGHYLAGFSCFIQGSSDILLAELYTIYKGLLLAKDMSIGELICYSDSL